MTDLAARDYFTDFAILKDPYAWFEAVRAHGPVHRLDSGIIVVTGFEECLEVLRNTADFSSALAPQGPAAPLPFTPQGQDITAQIEAHRTEFLGGDLVVAYDDEAHTRSRALLSRLFTPSKLKASDAFIADYADRLVRGVVAAGGCDLMPEIATPFVTMVIADLLGVPDDDRLVFMEAIDAGVGAGSLNPDDLEQQNAPLVLMGMYFAGYVADRRENPRDDVLTELSLAKYPDGSTPDAMEIVRLATFLFGAGQDTSAKLLGNALRFIVEDVGLQARLRTDPALIPAFLEEVLRIEGSTKMTARLARHDTHISGMPVPAGTKVMLGLAAANRDPRRWERPGELILGRPKIAEHLAFGRGAHVCAGAPLARVEVRVILELFLQHTTHIGLSEAVHGPKDHRNFDYDPSFIIRGLSALTLTFTPAAGFVAPDAPVPKAAPPPPPAAAAWSTATSQIGALLANPATKAVIDHHLPGVSADKRIGMAKRMTFRMVQKFAGDVFNDAALDAMDADLAKVPA